MNKQMASIVIFTGLFAAFAQTGHANEQIAAEIISNALKAISPEISSAASSISDEAEANKPSETLNFLSEKPLEPAASDHKRSMRTAIHFLTGIDVDQLASTIAIDEQLEGVEIPVSVLVFEKCTHQGDEAEGSSECEWRYSSGFRSTLSSSHTQSGDKKISRFMLTENDRGASWQGKREVLHTEIFEAGKIASETYDITYDLGLSPSGTTERETARTREVLLYHYDTASPEKKLRDMSWTKYADTREGIPREMEYHAVLTYDSEGRPERGSASKWSSGLKASTLFDWHSKKDIPDLSSREMWQMWEQWIKSGPSHVFIV